MATPGGTTVWMSERWMLEVLKDKMGWTYGTPEYMETLVHHKIKTGSHLMQKPLKEVAVTPVQSSFRSVPILPRTDNQSFEKVSTVVPAGYPYTTINKHTQHRQAHGQLRKFTGPDGLPISAVEYVELTKCGCAFCERRVKLFDSIYWTTDPVALDKDQKVAFFCDECVISKNYSYVNLSMFELTEGKIVYAS
jgi:hypothetical protein